MRAYYRLMRSVVRVAGVGVHQKPYKNVTFTGIKRRMADNKMKKKPEIGCKRVMLQHWDAPWLVRTKRLTGWLSRSSMFHVTVTMAQKAAGSQLGCFQ